MKKTSLAMLIIGLASISVMFADGDSRYATQGEKEFTVKVLRTAEEAIPAPPSGWTVEEKSEIVAPESVMADAEKYPLRVEYRQSWQHIERLEEARVKEEKMITEMAGSMQADQKGLTDTTRKLEALSAELAKALEKKDATEVSRIQNQMEVVANQINEVGESQNKKLEAEQQKIKPKDARVQFMFRVNFTNFDISRYKKDRDVSGFQTYRLELDDPNSSMEGEYAAFAGDFAPKTYESETWMELKTDPAAPSTSVQSIIIVVSGDKEHSRQLLESMNWTALKAMIKK